MKSQVYLIRFPNGKAYVGVSCQLQRRLRDHRKSNTLVGKALRKYAGQETVEVIHEGTPEECFAIEADRVSMLGTISPSGYNQTGGGLGGKSPSPEVNARRSKSLRKWWANPENRDAESVKRNDPKRRNALSEQASKVWEDPEKRERHLAARARPETKQLRSQVMAEVQSRPEVIKKKQSTANSQWSDPAMRAKMIEGMKAAAQRR